MATISKRRTLFALGCFMCTFVTIIQKRNFFQTLEDLPVFPTLAFDDDDDNYDTDDTDDSMDISSVIERKAKFLENFQHRFYMYSDPNITLDAMKGTYDLRFFGGPYQSYQIELEFDEDVFAMLKESNLRTDNPDEAEIFIVPIPWSYLISSRGMQYFKGALQAVLDHPIFQKHMGHNHVMLSTAYSVLFRYQKLTYMHPQLKRMITKIKNMTLAQSWDNNAIINALHNGVDMKEYSETFKEDAKVSFTRKTFSLELASRRSGTIVTPSVQKFHNSSYFVFYHTTTGNSVNNSTIYRHAPVNNVTHSDLPKSSIGWPIERDEYFKHIVDSKFCLNIRGDSPHSHAFLQSVQSGCIPVIISDLLPIYSPILKSTLNMEDFCIFLDEETFIQNPTKTLLSLNDISDDVIEQKIEHLKFAQRVTQLKHPQNLFVPAFLHEAMMATEAPSLAYPNGTKWFIQQGPLYEY